MSKIKSFGEILRECNPYYIRSFGEILREAEASWDESLRRIESIILRRDDLNNPAAFQKSIKDEAKHTLGCVP